MNNEPEGEPVTNPERVYTIADYYDGPREGVADFQGKRHIYKCQFSEAEDDWTDLFWLMEINQDLLELAKEQWAIFLRWSSELKLGNVSSIAIRPYPPTGYAMKNCEPPSEIGFGSSPSSQRPCERASSKASLRMTYWCSGRNRCHWPSRPH
jgi:hypothetical protein